MLKNTVLWVDLSTYSTSVRISNHYKDTNSLNTSEIYLRSNFKHLNIRWRFCVIACRSPPLRTPAALSSPVLNLEQRVSPPRRAADRALPVPVPNTLSPGSSSGGSTHRAAVCGPGRVRETERDVTTERRRRTRRRGGVFLCFGWLLFWFKKKKKKSCCLHHGYTESCWTCCCAGCSTEHLVRGEYPVDKSVFW